MSEVKRGRPKKDNSVIEQGPEKDSAIVEESEEVNKEDLYKEAKALEEEILKEEVLEDKSLKDKEEISAETTEDIVVHEKEVITKVIKTIKRPKGCKNCPYAYNSPVCSSCVNYSKENR